MARKLLEAPPSVEYVVPDGEFKGVTLICRKPTVADQVAAYSHAPGSEGRNLARLRLVEGWKGADGDPSPFLDANGGPLPFTEHNFGLACRSGLEFLNAAVSAASKAADETEDAILGKSRGASKDGSGGGPSTTPPPPGP